MGDSNENSRYVDITGFYFVNDCLFKRNWGRTKGPVDLSARTLCRETQGDSMFAPLYLLHMGFRPGLVREFGRVPENFQQWHTAR